MSQGTKDRRRFDRRWLTRGVFAATVLGLAGGGAAWLAGWPHLAAYFWQATTAIALLPLLVSTVLSLRRGEIGVDHVALLAMAGALILGEYLAGAVIALMMSGGEMLELFAGARARRELKALVERAPRVVHRYADDHLTEPPLEEVAPGDRLLVKPGEIVPVDGVLLSTAAVLDESALTGESVPAERLEGDRIASGVVNAGSPFDLRAVASAEQSTYAAIVRLVAEAEASRAPFVRLADRYSVWFLPFTVAVAALGWAISGDPVRALAVLVVATPCPLILAAPVAFLAGISQAARRGIIVKGGAALEALAGTRTMMLDKTGTVTRGEPAVVEIEAFGDLGDDELLRLAASLDQVSPHVLAAAIVKSARDRRLTLTFPSKVEERHGTGIEGDVEGHRIALGRLEWIAGADVPERAAAVRFRVAEEGLSNVWVGVDGNLAGVLILADPLRDDAAATIASLRRLGIDRILLVTGDHRAVAERVGATLGIDRVLFDQTPFDKVEAVKAQSRERPTAMVGDGVNDAPALAAASVGIALGARGATASSEAADMVLMLDRFDRVLDAVKISRRAQGIARQSVLAGMGLSMAAMVVAAAGYLPPVAGALLQEAIDVAVIVNALRALTPGRG